MSLPPTPDPDIQLTPLAGNETIALGGGVLGAPTMYTTTGAIAALGGGGGGGATGATGVLQASNGAGGFQVSNFLDQLTISGDVTANLLEDADGNGDPGFLISGNNPLLVVASASGQATYADINTYSYGNGSQSTVGLWTARGVQGAPTAVQSGDGLGVWATYGWTGSGYHRALFLNSTAESDFSSTQLSKIDCTNASDVGWHIATDGTFTIDGVVTSPALTAVAAATVTGATGVGTLTNTPVSGNPAVFIEISVNGITYAVPGWPLS